MKWYWWALGFAGAVILVSQVNRVRVMNDLSKIILGKNFTLAEFVKTRTGVENIPGDEAIEALRFLVQYGLQPLRDRVGKPITISSGYRSPDVNALQFQDLNKNGVRDENEPGSAKNSQHQRGQAADITIAGMTNKQIIDLIRSMGLPYDQLIDEVRVKDGVVVSSWVHWSLNNTRSLTAQRRQWLTYYETDGSGNYVNAA